MKKNNIKIFFILSSICGLFYFASALAGTNTGLYTILGGCQVVSCDGVTGICEETEDSYCSNLSPELPRSFPEGFFNQNNQVCAITGGGEETSIQPTSCSSIGCPGGDSEICPEDAQILAPQGSTVKTKNICSSTAYGYANYTSYTVSLPMTCCDQGSHPTSHGVCTPDSNQTLVIPDFNISSPLADLSTSILQNGDSYQFHAWYDPDGSGSQLVQDVTNEAKWTFQRIGIATEGGYVSVYNLNNILTVGTSSPEDLIEVFPEISYDELTGDEKVTVEMINLFFPEFENGESRIQPYEEFLRQNGLEEISKTEPKEPEDKFTWVREARAADQDGVKYLGGGIFLVSNADIATEFYNLTFEIWGAENKTGHQRVGGFAVPNVPDMKILINYLNGGQLGIAIKPEKNEYTRLLYENHVLDYSNGKWGVGPEGVRGFLFATKGALAHEDAHLWAGLSEKNKQEVKNKWNSLSLLVQSYYFWNLLHMNYAGTIQSWDIITEWYAFTQEGNVFGIGFEKFKLDFDIYLKYLIHQLTGMTGNNSWLLDQTITAFYDRKTNSVQLFMYDFNGNLLINTKIKGEDFMLFINHLRWYLDDEKTATKEEYIKALNNVILDLKNQEMPNYSNLGQSPTYNPPRIISISSLIEIEGLEIEEDNESTLGGYYLWDKTNGKNTILLRFSENVDDLEIINKVILADGKIEYLFNDSFLVITNEMGEKIWSGYSKLGSVEVTTNWINLVTSDLKLLDLELAGKKISELFATDDQPTKIISSAVDPKTGNLITVFDNSKQVTTSPDNDVIISIQSVIRIQDLEPSNDYTVSIEFPNGQAFNGVLVENDSSTFTIQTGDESEDAEVTIWKDGSGYMTCVPGEGCQMYGPDGEKTYYIDPYGYVINPNDGWNGQNPFDASRAMLGTGADEAHAQIDGWTRDVWGILHPSGGYIWPDGSWSASPLTSYMERQCELYKSDPVNYMYCGLGVSGNL